VFLPPIPDPGKILCVGVNYASHLKETGRPPQQYPLLFSRFSDSVVGADNSLVKPKESERLDYEGELAVIIGKGGRRISKQKAFEHVAGYSCFNDGSIRDWHSHSSQVLPGKNFPCSGAFGPWMATADEVPNIEKSILTTTVNGKKFNEQPFPIWCSISRL
jgi:2-keto-4-pentenoate hydratase/2-oxohepta-3-ene-1,7-dioic acid hydratase in catechol pathway